MLTPLQQRQLDEIDMSFTKLEIFDIDIRIFELVNFRCVVTVQPAMHLYDDRDDPSTVTDLADSDITKFEIKHCQSTYIRTMLERAGVYGFAICDKRDMPDEDFGVFVAKARLLKWIKKHKEML